MNPILDKPDKAKQKDNVIFSSVKIRSVIHSLESSRDTIENIIKNIKMIDTSKVLKCIQYECQHLSKYNNILSGEVAPSISHSTTADYYYSRLNNLSQDNIPYVQSALVNAPSGKISHTS